MSKKNKPDHNIHEGHRSRMMSRLIKNGSSDFQTHELLEILLYSSCKRCDTNPIAHNLIDEFGSLTGVLTASADELSKVEGVGTATANMLVSMGAVLRRLLEESVVKGDSLQGSDLAKDFCSSMFYLENSEQIRMIFLDGDYCFVSQEIISRGCIEQVKPDMLEIIEMAVKKRCPIVMLTHNHPKGSELPSNEDKLLTRNLFNLLQKVDIYLADHIIVGMYGTMSMRENDLLPDLWNELEKD